MPTRVRASYIVGNIDDIGITGEFEIRPEDRSPSYRIALNMDRVNLNTLKIPEKISTSFEQLKKDMSDPFSTPFITSLRGKYTIMLTGNNLLLNDNKINNAALDLTLASNIIDLRGLSFKSDDSDLLVTYKSTTTKENSTLSATVSSNALNMDIFFPARNNEENQAFAWSNNRFDFLDIQKVIGTIKMKIGYFKFNRLRLQQVEFEGDVDKGVMTLKRAQAQLGGGPVVVKGQIGIGESNSLGLSFGVNGAEISDILTIFTPDVSLRGKVYLSGKASSFGGTPLSLINNLTGSVRVSAKDVLANNLGLTNLIRESPLLKSAIDLDELKKVSLNSGTTLFNAIGGNIELKEGIASTRDLRIATQFSRGLIAMNLDLRSFMMKTLSRYRFAVGGGKILSIGLNLSGPVLNPTKELDVTEVEKFITDQAKRR
jgi:hypothetical protein